ncbi:hypothetical protein AJ79_04559 [Helicocarpus griseus UAMH5409]|uniref:Uncharacterized protein n=1 Tax=Helicocarpus griseus UAMH5409 TaxID=1447875 RepID=A0A2B7XTK0_9EURO|nr:hypothetical protein AJ79_04559 [Helicocarpus griseus UAMH5409]
MADIPVPIAVVGLSCRFPGGADSPVSLWRMLAEGRSAWSEVPEDRFNWRSFLHPDTEKQGAHNHRGGHFLGQDIAAFDANFFNIPIAEVEAIDPQQRIQLEVAYEALENAGIPIDRVRGTNTAVYTAVFSQDYAQMQFKDLDDLPKYHMTGTGMAILSNRISYVFDLKGPSMTVDTGCSGGLVAIHQGCQSLRSGECQMALAGGVNLILSPDLMIPMSLMHILNDDGKCYSFDTRGSGYGRGEGAAMIVLKRLDDAITDGDNIRAVIRNTGVNHDGNTQGITMPNSDAQRRLIQSVYRQASLDPSDTTYIEAHGTGTTVGDDAEIAAIQSVFGRGEGSRAHPLYVGSIKPNIGHLESASGIAGFIKAVLMLEEGMIPSNLNLQNMKENLNLKKFGISIPLELSAWPSTSRRRISVNSFGYGGTNGHAVIDAFTVSGNTDNISSSLNGYTAVNRHNLQRNGLTVSSRDTDGNSQIFAFTAKNEKSLVKMMECMQAWLSARIVNDTSNSRDQLFNLAHTLTSRRSLMQWRCSFTSTSLEGIIQSLKSKKPTRSSNNNRIVFVFGGQGGQWFAMGRELMSMQSPYRHSLQTSDMILRDFGATWSLFEELSQDEGHSLINEGEIAQPATTALQIALVDLLYSVGIKPDAVLGHSSGEIAAAYASGALSQREALLVAYHRGLLVNITRKGAMLAVNLGEDETAKYISQLKSGTAVLACSNSPESTTVSGDESAIAELEKLLHVVSVFYRRLKVSTAYHSHHVKAVAKTYQGALKELSNSLTRDSVKFISSVTAQEMNVGFGPKYWVRNLVSKVRFCDALKYCSTTLSKASSTTLASPTITFVEVGPHNVLSGPIRQTMLKLDSPTSPAFRSFSALLRNRNALSTFMDLACALFENGCPVDLKSVNLLINPHQKRKVLGDLPPYAWDHSDKYWHESRLSKAHRFRRHPYHDLLGVRVPTSTSLKPIWRHVFTLDTLPWLREHVIDGAVIFPGSGYLSMAIEAIRQVFSENHDQSKILRYILKDVSFKRALVVPEQPKSVELQISLGSRGVAHNSAVSGPEEFSIVSVTSDGVDVEHCHGHIMVEQRSVEHNVESTMEDDYISWKQVSNLAKLQTSLSESIDCKAMYNDLSANGNFYGPNFACIKELKLDSHGNALGTVAIPKIAESMPAKFVQPHVVHPTILDALMHSCIPLFRRRQKSSSAMAKGVGELVISADLVNIPDSPLTITSVLNRGGSMSATGEINVFQRNETGQPKLVVQIKEAELRSTGRSDKQSKSGRDMSYQMKWDIDSNHLTSSLFKLQDGNDSNEEQIQSQKLHHLNRAAAIYIRACLEQLPRDGPSSTHHRHFFNWMRKFYESSEWAGLAGGLTSKSQIESVLSSAKQLGVEGEILCRVGEKLSDILSGRVDPLALMIADDLLYRLYADDSSTRCYAHMARYLQHAVFKNPSMTILEIGAGTGGATAPLLQAIDSDGVLPIKRYDFTDVSAGFFDRSRMRLQKWESYLRFKRLDIQVDLEDQGFSEGSYDLIIASNVLHVANYIDKSLSRVRKLLRPGGRLLMIETTKVVPFYNAFLGVLPGWWAGVDDGRLNAPILTVEKWNASLQRTGFSKIEILARDYEGSAQRSAMIVSKAICHEDNMEVAKRKDLIPVKIALCPTWMQHRPKLAKELEAAFVQDGFDVDTEAFASNNDAVSPDTLYIVLDDGREPMLTTNSSSLFLQITKLLANATRVVWISAQDAEHFAKNPEKGLITGVARVARRENPSLRLITLDIQETVAFDLENFVQKIRDIVLNAFFMPPASRSSEVEYVYEGGLLRIPRLLPDMAINQRVRHTSGVERDELQPFHQPGRPLKLEVHPSGLLEKMTFTEDDVLKSALSDSDIEVQVEACGVNFKDVIIAVGQVKKPLPMSGEYSGTVINVAPTLQHKFEVGDRVCGFGATAYGSRIRVNGLASCVLPNSIPFNIGASLPVAFSTAHHALIDIAKLEKGQSVLIHSAAGGVGQAALIIAQQVGAEIFATVGNDSKRRLLIDEFGISDGYIWSSKDNMFRKGIQRLTNGKGVDVVLNSLSGQLLQETWDCVASFGTFIELGKNDIQSKSVVSMAPFDRNVTFTSIDLSLIYQQRPERAGKLLAKILAKIETGVYTPIKTIMVMPITDIEEAFRLMQTRKSVGKIVLESGSTAMVRAISKPPGPLQFNDRGTYLIAGGLGELGLEIAQFLIQRGAKHILLISRRSLDPAKRKEFEKQFTVSGAKVVVFLGDVTNLPRLQEIISSCRSMIPPIKGVIQATMVLQDRVLAQMELNDFQTVIRPKVTGTKNLVKVLEGHNLDFFVMLSSGASIIGNLSQANYAAGNAFMDSLASFTVKDGIPFLSINLGPIGDAGAMATSDRLKKILTRQGYIILELKQLLAAIEHSLGQEAKRNEYKQVVIGFDHLSLQESDNRYSLENPMFCHLSHVEGSTETKRDGSMTQSLEELIANTKKTEELESIVTQAIARRISTLVAVEYEDIDVQRRVVEFGFDSLVLIELKNWLTQTFQAKLQTSEISDAPHIVALAVTVVSRSKLVANSRDSRDTAGGEQGKQDDSSNGHDPNRNDVATEFPKTPQRKQPLPVLNATLDRYLEVVRPIFTYEEYSKVSVHVEEFRKPGGFGHELQNRLLRLENDPQIDNWQVELYTRGAYLRNREPLVPHWNFFGTHFMSPFSHSPAQRAAVISTAAFQFKQELDAGRLQCEVINEQPVGMELYDWFFNATREPQPVEDKMTKYPGNDYLVAFRRGHAYKIPLRRGNEPVSYQSLKTTFQTIIDAEQKEDSWVGVLTTDVRDSWADIRQILKNLSVDNERWLHIIDAAAFVIYLDEAQPCDASERGKQFLHGNGFNRWSDKSVQFCVCDNGVSATIGEHAMLDGVVIRRLNDFVTEAIMKLPEEAGSELGLSDQTAIPCPVEQYTFQTDMLLDYHIERVRGEVQRKVSRYEFAAFDITTVSNSIFRSHKCPPKSGMQMAIQLAVRKHLGYHPGAFETVSLSHFVQGRVDLNHVIGPAILKFCNAAANDGENIGSTGCSNLRVLFFDGVKEHAKNLIRGTQGYGVDRHLLCLKWSIHEDEEVPALFCGPLFEKSRPLKVMTDSLATGALECGATQPDVGSFWIHFEPEDERSVPAPLISEDEIQGKR